MTPGPEINDGAPPVKPHLCGTSKRFRGPTVCQIRRTRPITTIQDPAKAHLSQGSKVCGADFYSNRSLPKSLTLSTRCCRHLPYILITINMLGDEVRVFRWRAVVEKRRGARGAPEYAHRWITTGYSLAWQMTVDAPRKSSPLPPLAQIPLKTENIRPLRLKPHSRTLP